MEQSDEFLITARQLSTVFAEAKAVGGGYLVQTRKKKNRANKISRGHIYSNSTDDC